MLFTASSSRKNKASPSTNDNELNSTSPPKRERMQVSTPANSASCIKIEQLVKHDVWDIRRKDDGAFVMKKMTGNETGAFANPGTVNVSASTRTNAEQTGARPKVVIEVPKRNNAVIVNAANRQQNVNLVNSGNTVTAKPVIAPRMEVIMPEKNVITLTPAKTQRNNVITISTTPAPPKEVISVKSTGPEKGVLNLNAATAPKKDVMSTTLSTKKEVITISATPSPKKEVITINTKPLLKPTVFTINTGTKKDEEPSTSQVKGSVNARKITVHDIWSTLSAGSRHSAASASSKDSEPSVSGVKSDSGVQSLNFPAYDERVHNLHEIFPQVPLNVISEVLGNSESTEDAVDNLLARGVEEHVPSSEVPPAPPSEDDVIFIKSVKADEPKTDYVSPGKKTGAVNVSSAKKGGAVNVSSAKKGGATIKIELLARNEVWDIKKKDKEGFVMKKLTDGRETESQRSKPDGNSVSQANESVEVMEEELDEDTMLDDMLLDHMSHVGNPEQSNAPVKLMVYSKSSDNTSSKKDATPSGEENLGSAMEVDRFDNSYSNLQEKALIEEFEFSDDENEDGETVEYFLFKASLVLKKLKYRCESESQTPGNSALLNITGSMKNEETSESVATMEDCSGGDSDEFYTDECYTDEED